jgi:ATP-dependent DNA helicase
VTDKFDATKSTQRFHGLFIGINKYQSHYIGNLASAVRDADALHALFSDNLGDNCLILTDAGATTERLRKELNALQNESTDEDVVVIAFSGHGSDTHELITFDTDPYDLSGTALPLAELTDIVSAIPAKHLLVILDCCFSGGAGAKVLHAPRRPRGSRGGLPLSTEAFLEQMAGTGRVLLTASTANQEAWEDPGLGHGYLTYYLIQALLGPGDVASNNRINLLDLLRFVTSNVKASVSSSYGVRQEPTLRGRWDGEVIWPVFAPGPRYETLYPSKQAAPVTQEIRSLAGHGLPDSVLDAWASALPGLNRLQQNAVNEAGLFKGNNVLVMAPTSSGKTMIGELAALRATQVGGRSVFLLPTKALVNEQYERFARSYGPAGIGVIRATGDHNDDIPALLGGQFDIALFTHEKFSGLALAHPHLLRMVSVVVVDEVQTIVDPSRGRELELLLTLMKSRRDQGVQPQIIALSAVLGDINGLDSWLDAYLLKSSERPVPLEEGVLNLQGQYRFIDADGTEQVTQLLRGTYGEPRARTLIVPLVQQLVADGQQVIVIRGIRGDTRGEAMYLANSLTLPAADRALAELLDDDQTRSSAELRQCLQGGVAFHISDLSPTERRVIEEEFRLPDSQIRVVVATTTLAQGVNMPAETVIMPELSRRIGRELQWYSVAAYKNIAGRAGRLGLTERGRAIVLAYDASTANHVWNNYILGTPEDVHSALLDPNVDLYTVVLRIVAIASDRSEDGSAAVEDLVGILASSLAAHQVRLRQNVDVFRPDQITTAITELQRFGFLELMGDNRTKLSALGALVAGSTLSVESAIRVTSALRRVRPDQFNRATVLAVAQVTEELDDTRLTVNARGVQRELSTFIGQLQAQRIAGAVIDALSESATDRIALAARAKKSIACLLWIRGVPLAQIEESVMQHYFDRNASGPIRAVVSRTHDVLDTVVAIAAELHPTADLADLAELLPVQLELGVPVESARLALAGADLQRDDYRRLQAAGLTAPEAIVQADDSTLLTLLRNNRSSLESLRDAAVSLQQKAAEPTLEELLGDAEV